MGRGASERAVGLPHNAQEVYGRNAFFNDLWSRGSDPRENRAMYYEGLKLYAKKNDTRLVEDLDLLEERREMALIRLANYQQKLAQRYDRSVRPREFVAGDLVLRKAVGSMKNLSAGKLALNWEGLYRITAVVGARAYYLEDMKERPLP